MVSKKLLDRLREAFKSYGRDVLGDADITVDFFPTDYEGSVGIFLTSPRLKYLRKIYKNRAEWEEDSRQILTSHGPQWQAWRQIEALYLKLVTTD